MKRMAWLAASVALVGWGVASAVGGCGGTAADPSEPTVGPGDNTVDSSTNGQGSVDSGGGTSNTAYDAGTDPGTGNDYDSGPSQPVQTTNPGKITCGTSECDAGLFAAGCCVQDGGATCSSSPICAGGLALKCDESSDCTGLGQLKPSCCLTTSALGASTACNPVGCGAQGILLCKSDDECGDGGAVPCNLKTCAGYSLHVCGAPDGCN
jgi:hypothetical protein